MTWDAARVILENRFIAQWALGAHSTVEVDWTNASFDEEAQNDPWVRFNFITGDAFPIDIGSNGINREEGLVIVQCFVQHETGTGECIRIADSVASVFPGGLQLGVVTDPSGVITFRNPEKVDAGETGRWYQINVLCPFFRNSI